ncbi:MAG: hypothetical protein ACLGPL_00300, partial [Acidobacteriota bacterium]
MSDRKSNQAARLVDDFIAVWGRNPDLGPLVEALKEGRKQLIGQVRAMLEGEEARRSAFDRARSHIIRYGLERVDVDLQSEHFVM